ncbi:hypothetical protein BC828DRAFT_406139 [Blastocladiella britannica]|nr:hypothetical protein BC828DRAFT_406139 [Blastocladiella britannica]
MSTTSPTTSTTESRIKELAALMDGIGVAMLTSRRPDGRLVSRAMKLSGRESSVDLAFVTSTASLKLDELRYDPHVNVAFYKDGTGEWVSIAGLASIRTLADPTGTGTSGLAGIIRSADQQELEKQGFRDLVSKVWTGDTAEWFPNLNGDQHPAEDPRVAIISVRAITATYAALSSPPWSSPRVLFDLAASAITGQPASGHHIETRNLATPELLDARQAATASLISKMKRSNLATSEPIQGGETGSEVYSEE